MFKRVLLAIDASDTSMRGLEAAINLAGDQQAELHVMHDSACRTASCGREWLMTD